MSLISKTFLENNDFLKRFLMGFLKCEQSVEDIVQDVYIKAYKAEKTKPIEHPKAFLFTIAKNLALNELNRKNKQIFSYIDEVTDSVEEESDSLESELEANNKIELYCQAIAELPEKCRKVFLLRKVHGMKHQDIADKLNISLSSVEKYLKLGATSCRDYLIRHEANFEEQSNRRKAGKRNVL